MGWRGRLHTPFQERLPAKERRLLDMGGNMLVPQNYEVTKFHEDYIRSSRGKGVFEGNSASYPHPSFVLLHVVRPSIDTTKSYFSLDPGSTK